MKVTEKILNKIKSAVSDKNVLEVACGSADLSIEMSSVARLVRCIDLVDFRLNPSIGNCANVKFFVMDATKMTFADNLFDVAVIYNAAYHIKDEFASILSECRRVVKSGGNILIISTFSIDTLAIEDTLLPLLRQTGIYFTVEQSQNLVLINVTA